MAIPPVPLPTTTYIIDVSYTPETTGCHVICFHMKLFVPAGGGGNLGPDVEYCCVQDVDITPAMVGVSRVVQVDAGDDAECPGNFTVVGAIGPNTPGTYTYEGYVYPCCNPAITVAWPVALPTFTIAVP